MGKNRTIPGAAQMTDLPVGFTLCYNDVHGVRGMALRLSNDITADPERVKQHLYDTFEALCNAMDPTRVHRRRALDEKRERDAKSELAKSIERAILGPDADLSFDDMRRQARNNLLATDFTGAGGREALGKVLGQHAIDRTREHAIVDVVPEPTQTAVEQLDGLLKEANDDAAPQRSVK